MHAVEPLGQPPHLPVGADVAGDRGAGQAPTVEVVKEVLGVDHGVPQLGEPQANRVTIKVTIKVTEANRMLNSCNVQSLNGIYL